MWMQGEMLKMENAFNLNSTTALSGSRFVLKMERITKQAAWRDGY